MNDVYIVFHINAYCMLVLTVCPFSYGIQCHGLFGFPWGGIQTVFRASVKVLATINSPRPYIIIGTNLSTYM